MVERRFTSHDHMKSGSFLGQLLSVEIQARSPVITYAKSRLPRLRAISNSSLEFWGKYPALMVVPVVRQDQALEGEKVLHTTATWWLRDSSGFVDNELTLSSHTSDVSSLLGAIGNFADQASAKASGDVDHTTLDSWFGSVHDLSTVQARIRRQVNTQQLPATWEGRIGWSALQKLEYTTAWARPLADGRQDTRGSLHTFNYDSRGALSQTIQDDGGGTLHTRTITKRAASGAVTELTESAADDWNGPEDKKSWSYQVDEYGLYTVATTNPYGHVATTRYDYASGQPVRTEDADGVVTRAQYDGFGRLAFETVAGTETSVSYAWMSAAPVTVRLTANPTGIHEIRINASYRVVETTTRVSPERTFKEVSSQTWYDPAGRVVRSGQRGPLGEMVWSEFGYDKMGHLALQTRPHTNNTASTQGGIVFAYDSLDRPTRVTRPNDTLSGTRWDETQYGSGGDPGALAPWLGRTSGAVRGILHASSDTQRAALVRTFDAEGRLLSSLEQHAQESETPVTTYAPGLDGPMAITGPDGETLRTDFDRLGRIKRTVDPASGTFTQRYDAFGRVREQLDNGTLHNLEYDLLDRPVLHSRAYQGHDEAFGVFGAEKVTTWTWDVLPDRQPKPKDRGKLLRISSNDGNTEDYTYGGPFALQDSVTRGILRRGGDPLRLETSYEYDGDGRPTVLRHPSAGLSAQRAQTYRYNERGALTAIDATMAESTRTIWELQEVYQGGLPSRAKVLEAYMSS